MQSSEKHNQIMHQGVNSLSCFIVDKIWSTAIKIIYRIFCITLTEIGRKPSGILKVLPLIFESKISW